MNCETFEKLVCDLVRGQLPDAAERGHAQDHAQGCRRCAVRLAEERTLTDRLWALADADARREAPAGIEFALLAAFRNEPSRVDSIPTHSPSKHVMPGWGWAAAPATLLVFGLLVFGLLGGLIAYRSLPSHLPAFGEDRAGKGPDHRPDNRKDLALVMSTPTVNPAQVSPKEISIAIQHFNGARSSKQKKQLRHARPSQKYFIRDEITSYSGSEFTSDFLPLDFADTQSALENGRVIRIQVPRPALIRLGFPINVERADMPVNADLLVGDDGLARAIRFVR